MNQFFKNKNQLQKTDVKSEYWDVTKTLRIFLDDFQWHHTIIYFGFCCVYVYTFIYGQMKYTRPDGRFLNLDYFAIF